MVYVLLLEKEKFHHLKRFYLLFSLLFSLAVPLVEMQVSNPASPLSEASATLGSYERQINTNTTLPLKEHAPDYTYYVMLIIYIIISSLLFFRFVKNLYSIFQSIKRSERIAYRNGEIALINSSIIPHSFLSYIFLNKTDFEKGKIEKEILEHEKVHINQKHSLDILFVELLQIFFWFNPFIILYKRAIRINHEFLADDAVIKKYKDISVYQHLLLSHAAYSSNSSFGSPLNYSLTKKRFTMMTRTTSVFTTLWKQLLLLPLIVATTLVFSSKIIAQDTTPAKHKELKAIEHTQEGTSQELLGEYNAIIGKHQKINKAGWPYFTTSISNTERNRLETIFKQMSKAQQDKQLVIFMPPPSPLPKVIPTRQQIASWKNDKIYGVWIDNKRAKNNDLDNYANTDFAQVFVSKLSKNAINYGKHYYQVDLMTKSYYENYYKMASANNQNIMVFRRKIKKQKK